MPIEFTTIDKGQIKRVHALLAAIGMGGDKEYKAELVQLYSHGRVASTKDLLHIEASFLIADLQKMADKPLTPEQVKADNKRKLILSYAHKMGWEKANGKVDIARVDAWCVKSGYLHKPFNDYSLLELSKLVWQMETVYKSYLTSI